MTQLRRQIYRWLLRLHPAAFRDEFAYEMYLDFNDAIRDRAALPFCRDCLLSLGRQWMAHSFSSQPIPQPATGRPLLSGSYGMIDVDRLTPFELLRGLLLSVALIAILAFAPTRAIRTSIQPANPAAMRGTVPGGTPSMTRGGDQDGQSRSGGRSSQSVLATQKATAREVSDRSAMVAATTASVLTGVSARVPADALREGSNGAIIYSLGAYIAFAYKLNTPQNSNPPVRMPAAAHPEFEVAAIKLTDPDSRRLGISGDAHGTQLHGMTVNSMMMFAYGLHPAQIVDGPAWRSIDRYDVTGTSTVPGQPDVKQLQEMLRQLLADRFGLKVHHDKREMNYYGIEVGKSGAKLTKSAVQDAGPGQGGGSSNGVMEMRFTSNTMSDFSLGMQNFLDRPAVDETGLSGRYNFVLRWTSNDATPTEANAPPGLFTAMQEQLGLKAEPKKGLVDLVVIDGLTRPSEN